MSKPRLGQFMAADVLPLMARANGLDLDHANIETVLAHIDTAATMAALVYSVDLDDDIALAGIYSAGPNE